MSTIQERIQFAAAENTRLSSTISETAYSVSAHQQSQNYVGDLKKEISGEEKRLAKINREVEKEYKEHQSYRDSHMKRLAYKLGGKKEKFADRATKEEKEWLDAVAGQLRVKKNLETLNAHLAEATKTSAEFHSVVEVHKKAKADLDALYNSVFKGPTPGMPEEDAKENEAGQAENSFNTVQFHLSTEQQVRSILGEADQYLRNAIMSIQDAENSATADVWGVGGTFAEVTESNALSRCEQLVSQVQMLINQAQRMQVR